jgi:hypothetical protein
MDVEMVFRAKNLSKEELRALLQKIREWELSTPRSELDGFTFKTEPEMSSSETLELFAGITPKYENVISVPLPKNPVISLGTRGLVVNGELLGTVDELSLTVGEAGEGEMMKLLRAQTIQLVRMAKG